MHVPHLDPSSITSSANLPPDERSGGVLPNHQLAPEQDTSPTPVLSLRHSGTRTISRSTFSYHVNVAEALSFNLDELGVHHAYIGNFAWVLLGCIRPVKSVDVLIEVPDIVILLEQLVKRDSRFTLIGSKLYCVLQQVEECDEAAASPSAHELLRPTGMPVQFSRTGIMGLPVNITSTHKVRELGIEVLHPAILIIIKLERWFANHASTGLQAVRKAVSHHHDIRFIIFWLSESGESIRFHEYHGKTKPEVLVMVRQYHNKYSGDVEQMVKLRAIMPDDWDDMLASTLGHEEGSNLPP